MPIDPIERAVQLVSRTIPARELIVWLNERLENCRRIAKLKRGDDRAGWLEDAAYFCGVIATMEAAEQRVVEVEKERDELRTDRDQVLDILNSYRGTYTREKERAEAAEQQSAQLRSALAELVRLRDTEKNLLPMFRDHSAAECAWIAARKALEGETNEQR